MDKFLLPSTSAKKRFQKTTMSAIQRTTYTRTFGSGRFHQAGDGFFKKPVRGTIGSAGYDLFASKAMPMITDDMPVEIPTNVCHTMKKGEVGMICNRSSNNKRGFTVTPAVVDQDYTGEIFIWLKANRNRVVHVQKGQAVAQLLIMKYVRDEGEDIVTKVRGDGSKGSTDPQFDGADDEVIVVASEDCTCMADEGGDITCKVHGVTCADLESPLSEAGSVTSIDPMNDLQAAVGLSGLGGGLVVYLHGPIGAGKTTMAKNLVKRWPSGGAAYVTEPTRRHFVKGVELLYQSANEGKGESFSLGAFEAYCGLAYHEVEQEAYERAVELASPNDTRPWLLVVDRGVLDVAGFADVYDRAATDDWVGRQTLAETGRLMQRANNWYGVLYKRLGAAVRHVYLDVSYERQINNIKDRATMGPPGVDAAMRRQEWKAFRDTFGGGATIEDAKKFRQVIEDSLGDVPLVVVKAGAEYPTPEDAAVMLTSTLTHI